jgi:release factor glutamine methyltransferase
MEGKKVLELGAGSGLISVVAGKKGARVTATDINEAAVENVRRNAGLNRVYLNTVRSDLFDAIDGIDYDIILINPPFYPRDPVTMSDRAWYCGSDFQYFNKLFFQLRRFAHTPARILMILSEDCQIERIEALAAERHFQLKRISVFRKWLEDFTVYSIEPL